MAAWAPFMLGCVSRPWGPGLLRRHLDWSCPRRSWWCACGNTMYMVPACGILPQERASTSPRHQGLPCRRPLARRALPSVTWRFRLRRLRLLRLLLLLLRRLAAVRRRITSGPRSFLACRGRTSGHTETRWAISSRTTPRTACGAAQDSSGCGTVGLRLRVTETLLYGGQPPQAPARACKARAAFRPRLATAGCLRLSIIRRPSGYSLWRKLRSIPATRRLRCLAATRLTLS